MTDALRVPDRHGRLHIANGPGDADLQPTLCGGIVLPWSRRAGAVTCSDCRDEQAALDTFGKPVCPRTAT